MRDPLPVWLRDCREPRPDEIAEDREYVDSSSTIRIFVDWLRLRFWLRVRLAVLAVVVKVPGLSPHSLTVVKVLGLSEYNLHGAGPE